MKPSSTQKLTTASRRIGRARSQRGGRPRLRTKRGFTLVEMVVALALGAALLAAVQGLLVSVYRGGYALERRAACAAAGVLPFDLLRQDLLNRPAGGGLRLAENRLRLATLSAMQSPRLAARHAVVVQYALEPADDGTLRLTRREQRNGDENDRRVGVDVASGLSAASFAIYDGRHWHERWPPQIARGAHAVRMVLAWPDDTRRESVVWLTPPSWSRHDD